MRLLALLVIIGCSAPAPKPTPKPAGGSPFERFATMSPRVGDIAPAFALADVDGNTVTLSDATARGPVVLVWGSFT